MTILFALLWLFVGATLGCVAMALAIAAKDLDEYEKGYWRGIREAEKD
jgi:hypothetical protein